MPILKPDQIDELTKLLSSTLNFDQLENYVYRGTGDQLYVAFVGQGQPLRTTIRKLIKALELEPITDRFLRVVYREKPLQTALRAFIAAHYPDIPGKAGREPVTFSFQENGVSRQAPSEGPGLERAVKPALKMMPAQIWLDRFEAIKRLVCRVEVDGAGIGTGFLVGPGAILTNWHVAREARSRRATDKMACRFDYRRLTGGGIDPGAVIPVAEVVDERPCSDAELTANPDDPPPNAAELDYALLRLAEAQPDRGFLDLADAPPVASHDPLIIVQHPQGDPLDFAIDTDAVIATLYDGLRLRYSTNTEAGSSGSPCFSMDWDLLAIHHYGDPRRGPAKFNQGIPVGLIRRSITANGFGALLGS